MKNNDYYDFCITGPTDMIKNIWFFFCQTEQIGLKTFVSSIEDPYSPRTTDQKHPILLMLPTIPNSISKDKIHDWKIEHWGSSGLSTICVVELQKNNPSEGIDTLGATILSDIPEEIIHKYMEQSRILNDDVCIMLYYLENEAEENDTEYVPNENVN